MGKSTINGPFSIAMLNYQREPLWLKVAKIDETHMDWTPTCRRIWYQTHSETYPFILPKVAIGKSLEHNSTDFGGLVGLVLFSLRISLSAQRKPERSYLLHPLVNSPKKRWKDPPFSMGDSTISMAIFQFAMLVHQRVLYPDWWGLSLTLK